MQPSNDHTHHWVIKIATIDNVDCFSGLACECGVMLTPATLETLANTFEPARQAIEAEFAEIIAFHEVRKLAKALAPIPFSS